MPREPVDPTSGQQQFNPGPDESENRIRGVHEAIDRLAARAADERPQGYRHADYETASPSHHIEDWLEFTEPGVKARRDLTEVVDHFGLATYDDAISVSARLSAVVVAELKRGGRIIVEHANGAASELMLTARQGD